MNYLVVTIKSWNIKNFRALKKTDKKNHWFLITKKEDLTVEKIKKIKPRYIFFPHWSWIIPKEIYNNFESIVFHMTDLPYGRGGSPMQNLIVRGRKNTKLSAIKVADGLDTGDIYFKRPLSLKGTAAEILKRASDLTFKMIKKITETNPSPAPQTGEPVLFKRRKPEDGDISKLVDLEKVYDYIRMLDAEGYPAAFLESERLRLEFSEAKFKNKELTAKVKIIIKKYE